LIRFRTLLLAALLGPHGLAGQTVTGAVTDGATGQPIPGAMVRLMEGDRWTGVLHLTSGDGRFLLRAPAPGSYHLMVERIGFAETVAGPVVLAAGESVAIAVRVDAEPVRLEGLDVSAGRRRCSLRGDAAGATQALWGEIRKALDAARWTEREAGLRFQVVQRTRSLDAKGLRVQDESHRVSTLYGGNSVRTLPPEDLADGGYVREVDENVYHYGPDAEVLLSDPFLDTHCFRIVDPPREEPHLVGLEFQPIRGQDQPDIRGVLWADRATARLERVEFSYTGLGRRPGADQASGALRFAELADGRWIVRDWFIRAPLLGVARQFVGGVLRERLVVEGVQEQGTEVVSASGPDVAWRAADPSGGVPGLVHGGEAEGAPAAPSSMTLLAQRCRGTARVVGTVTDGPGGPGVSGAVVTAVLLDHPGAIPLSAVTTPEGGFWLCGPRDTGRVRVVARLGSLGSEPTDVQTSPEGYVVRDLVLPPGTPEASSDR
jgi:hypothetical protein